MSILIIDDNEVIGMVIANILRKSNYDAFHTLTGMDALNIVQERKDISLVICDIMMPEMNGFEFYQKIKAIPACNHIPFVFCSSLSNAENVKKAAQMGCKYYLLKPIQANLLLLKVAEVFAATPPALPSMKANCYKHNWDQATYDKNILNFLHFLSEEKAALDVEMQTPYLTNTKLRLGLLVETCNKMGATPLRMAAEAFKESMSNNSEVTNAREKICGEFQRLLDVINAQVKPGGPHQSDDKARILEAARIV